MYKIDETNKNIGLLKTTMARGSFKDIKVLKVLKKVLFGHIVITLYDLIARRTFSNRNN